jgi:PilZ domain
VKRRSSRIALSTPVRLYGQDQSAQFDAKATNLNRYGAAVQLKAELSVGSTVVVRNMRGTKATARVVAQVGAMETFRTYGIEFLGEDEKLETFWGIAFPPKT